MYGTVRTVVWEDGGREAASYPIAWILIAVAARLTTAQHCAGFGRQAAKSATIATLEKLPAIA